LTPQGFKGDEDVPLAKAALRGLLTTKTARTVRPCWLSWPAGSVRQCSLRHPELSSMRCTHAGRAACPRGGCAAACDS
jgi:hypothetical protein